MKNIILLLIMLAFTGLSAQDVISEVRTFVPYQDSLRLLKTVTVTNTGIEGVNDTTRTYQVTTVDELTTQIHASYLNTTNTDVARLRAARNFRTILNNYNDQKALLATLGKDLDSLNVAQYGNVLVGRYRIYPPNEASYFADIATNPNQSGLLRATGTNNEGNSNVLVYGRWFLRVNLNGTAHYLLWDGNSTERPVYVHPSTFFPNTIFPTNSTRIVKIR